MRSDVLHQRLRAMKARAAIRKWEARQIGHAGGVWFRFQLLLAGTTRLLAITDDDAAILAARGFEMHPVGAELEPSKSLFVIREDALPASIRGRDVSLQDGHQILLSRALVLIPFR